jgi:hypothetical protein
VTGAVLSLVFLISSNEGQLMTKRRSLIVPAVLAGVLLLALAVLYIAEPASSLPATPAPADASLTR